MCRVYDTIPGQKISYFVVATALLGGKKMSPLMFEVGS
jgi:hypothetical protein